MTTHLLHAKGVKEPRKSLGKGQMTLGFPSDGRGVSQQARSCPVPCTCVAGCRPEMKAKRAIAAGGSHHPTRRKRKLSLSVDKEEEEVFPAYEEV